MSQLIKNLNGSNDTHRCTHILKYICFRIKIFCNYNDERNGLLSVCDIVWINYSEKDVNYFITCSFNLRVEFS